MTYVDTQMLAWVQARTLNIDVRTPCREVGGTVEAGVTNDPQARPREAVAHAHERGGRQLKVIRMGSYVGIAGVERGRL